MYFESVLSYLATFINDISLMNLSIETSRPIFYISSLSFPSVSPWSCSSMAQLTSFQQFNLSFFNRYQTPFGNSLFVGTAKVRMFFNLASFLFFISAFSFLLFVRRQNRKSKRLTHSSYPLTTFQCTTPFFNSDHLIFLRSGLQK